ncbi:YdeI family protein [Streptomyces sp. NPDC001544]|uniref:YdeI/OmpD-associated family protein n=1 Tax=Streptomyces sp. NPDC001544 TaxID=3364584 RepID=UPI003675B799
MVNVRMVEELAAEGRMRPGGLAEVAAAQADGRWGAAYASQKEAAVPRELTVALDGSPRVRAAFEVFGRTDRHLVMLGVLRARTPPARAAQAEAAVAKLAGGRGVRRS